MQHKLINPSTDTNTASPLEKQRILKIRRETNHLKAQRDMKPTRSLQIIAKMVSELSGKISCFTDGLQVLFLTVEAFSQVADRAKKKPKKPKQALTKPFSFGDEYQKHALKHVTRPMSEREKRSTALPYMLAMLRPLAAEKKVGTLLS